MGYRIIYIEQSQQLRLYLDNLKVETERGELTFPLSDIQTLIIDNNRTNLSVRLIDELSNHNVCTILCGIDHLPNCQLLPINGHFAQSGNILRQITWHEQIKKKLHKEIVKGKITNQIAIMTKYKCPDSSIDMLVKFREEVEDGDLGNREGLAAKVYFRSLFGPAFVRFESDVVNAGLNYGYSIFRSLLASVIVSKGYLPNLGIFHRGKENMFNLADDLIEVFRPVVDDYVREYLYDSVLFSSEDREGLIRLSTGRLQYNFMTQTVGNTAALYFENILSCIEKNSVEDFLFPDCQISYDI